MSGSPRIRLHGALMDLTPLRESPLFRRFWLGRSLSIMGSRIAAVAVMFQIWESTHSVLWSGAVGIAHAIPMLLLSVIAGSSADRHDRRRIQIVTTTGQAAVSIALAVQALVGGLSPLLLLGLIALQSAVAAFGGPASRSLVPRLVPGEQLAAGLALTGISAQTAMLLGPALGGLLIGWIGLAGCYLVDAGTFAAAFIGVFGLPALRPLGDTAQPGWAGIREGLLFLRRHPVIRALLLTDLAATVLAMPISLFPLINQQLFNGDPRTLGLFLSAIGVGGVMASVLSGTFTRSEQQFRWVVGGALVWGTSLGLVGVSAFIDWPVAVLALLVVAGAADTASVVSRGALVQRLTPDELRGRVGAVELLVGMTGPDLGNVRAGVVARVTSGAVALVSGGALCVAVVLGLRWRTPELRARTRTESGDLSAPSRSGESS